MKNAIVCFIGLVFVVSVSAEPLLEGRVRLESGEPVADAQVRLFDMTDLRQGAIARAQTDGRGYFALPLAALGGRALPARFALGSNYPNPFNPSTIIPYQLAASAAVRLEVFNLLGQRIATLVDGERAAGFHTATWTATDAAGRAVGAGVYIYRMTVGAASQTGRMVLLDGQAGVAAGGSASVWSGVSDGGGSDGTGEQAYGLIVSGEGLVPYVDSAFRVEAGMAPVELVVSEGQYSAGKATDDDLSDLFGVFNEQQEEEEDEATEEEEETDSTSSEGGPDLIVQSPSASAVMLTPGQAFTLQVTVQNQGDQQAAATMLRYYRSNNATITVGDTEVGTGAVDALAASSTSEQSIELAASVGVERYYGACVASVDGESNTDNNCSSAVKITVSGQVATEDEEDETTQEEETEEEDEVSGEEGTDGQVVIPDANLRAAIAAALGKASGAPITQADMETLDTIDDPSFWGQGISDLTGLEYAINLTYLDIFDNDISDISPLEGLTQLRYLDLSWNKIVDLSPLTGLTKLEEVSLQKNRIRDLAPLMETGNLLHLNVRRNPLNAASIDTHVPVLQARGVIVSFDDVVVFTVPQIYNDNVFVLPIAGNLAGGIDKLPLRNYAKRFYEHFNDEFDFLIFFPSLLIGEQELEVPDGGFYSMVKNDVQGISGSDLGFPTFGDTYFEGTFFDSDWGSSEKLQGVIAFWTYILNPTPHSDIHNGTLLHEIMHRWGNYIVSPWSHWGFSTSGGYLLCTNITNMIDYGDGKFSYESISPSQYSPLELYLAGFIPAEEVPDWRVAEDGAWLRDEQGRIIEDDNGYRMFTASGFKSYTIEDIIAAYGPRVPDHSQAQKDFRAAVILLVSEDYPATQEILERVSNAVSWFSYAGEDESDPRSNFYEATGGRGTITMGGLSQLRR